MPIPIKKFASISSSQGVHFVTLKSVSATLLVEGIPEKGLPRANSDLCASTKRQVIVRNQNKRRR